MRRPGDDPAVIEQEDVALARETGALLEPMDEAAVERDGRDHDPP